MGRIRAHEFEARGGRYVDEGGRARWPDSLNVYLKRWQAFDLMETLMRQLRDPEDQIIQFSIMGRLDFDIEEDMFDRGERTDGENADV